MEMEPEGHLLFIHNIDAPGAIGSIGVCLGKNNVNISRMQVGQEKDGDRNVILLAADQPIPQEVIDELRKLPLVKTVTPLDL
jgi:D-3-phosphoglycerate dehydrogenase